MLPNGSYQWILISIVLSYPNKIANVPISIKYNKPSALTNVIRNHSLSQFHSNSFHDNYAALSNSGCGYKSVSYRSGEEVPTSEPCLYCQCKNQAVVCKLRICTEPVPDAPPSGCYIVQKIKACCSELVCPGSQKTITREQRLSTENRQNISADTITSSQDQPKPCFYQGTKYAEGSAMKSESACDYCFCIRGEMKCSKPQCVMPLNGCKPKYRSFSCCPTNYDCSESNDNVISSISLLSTTRVPTFLKGCRLRGRFIYEGEPVLAIDVESNVDPCQSCFCVNGLIQCRPMECTQPIEGCKAIVEDGHCCPSRYDCYNQATIQTKDSQPESEELTLVNEASHKEYGHLPVTVWRDDSENDYDDDGYDEYNKNDESDIFSRKIVNPPLTTTNFAIGNLTVDSNNLQALESRERRIHNSAGQLSSVNINSYEDDERDYLFGIPTLEAIDHDTISKIMNSQGIIADTTTRKKRKESELKLESAQEAHISPLKSHFPSSLYRVQKQRNITQQTLDGNSNIDTNAKFLETMKHETIPYVSSIPISISSTIATETLSGGTVSNLEFIPFGLEDVLHLPPTANYFLPKLTYDAANVHSANPVEVITPSQSVPSFTSAQSDFPSGGFTLEFSKDNAIMDIPVSTSLYKNGYYLPRNDSLGSREGDLSISGSFSSAPGGFPNISENVLGFPISSPLILGGFSGMTESSIGRVPISNGGFNYPDNMSGNQSKPSDGFLFPFRLPRPSLSNTSANEDLVASGLKHNPKSKVNTPITLENFKDYSLTNLSSLQAAPTSNLNRTNEVKKLAVSSAPTSQKSNFKKVQIQRPGDLTEFSNRLEPKSNGEDKAESVLLTTLSPSINEASTPSIGTDGFRPIVSVPFKIAKPMIGSSGFGFLKLSGCNIYGKMYNVGTVIRELSGPCIRCECTDFGVQCSESPC